MTKDETLKLALEALEDACGDRCNSEYNPCFQREAITAIKEALANEALEKMAENARELGLDYEPEQDWIERERAVGYREGHQNAIKQMAQPEQKPVAWEQFYPDMGKPQLTPPQGIYYTPPQRTWVDATTWRGLTLDERIELAQDVDWAIGAYCEYAEKIEAKLKAKNSL